MTHSHDVRAGHGTGWVLALAVGLLPSIAGAQQAGRPQPQASEPLERPTRAVFDGSRQPRRDVLNLTTEMYGGHDQELQAVPGGGSLGHIRTGAFAGLDAGLSFMPTQNPTVDFNARAFTSLRYYSNPAEFVPAASNADATASFTLGRRTSLQTRGGVMYFPYFDFPFVAEIPDPGVLEPVPVRVRDVAASSRRIGTYDGGASLSYSVTQRVGVGVGYGVRRTDLIEESQAAVDTTASAQLNLQLNRRITSRIAFVHREGAHEAGGASPQPVQMNDLEISVDRDWARSPTRQTHFTFTGGPSRVEQAGRQLTRASFGVGVTHAFARSWDVRATYRRGVTFLDSAAEPVLSNSVTLNLSGMLTRRLEASIGVSAILGEVGLEAVEAQTYDSYYGSVRGRFGLSRNLALYGEYVYQQHSYLDPTLADATGQDRSGVRGGITWYVPLLQESQRPERPRSRRSGERP